jgi:hypothetical protein
LFACRVLGEEWLRTEVPISLILPVKGYIMPPLICLEKYFLKLKVEQCSIKHLKET